MASLSSFSSNPSQGNFSLTNSGIVLTTKTFDYDPITNVGNIKPENIDSKSFMNNIKVKLKRGHHFISWYQSFHIQAKIYNVRIRACTDIDEDNLSRFDPFYKKYPDVTREMSSKTAIFIGQLLLKKFNSGDIIHPTFTEAINTLTFVNNRYKFLNIFL